ncbi:hypothetical protein C5167_014767 [Papaver somniferum]|uniref:Bowman-Birk serine protease inhibitors family domain-containing protein n=1 Tax=Papaver somniferum TaxID=3469 RepID=A0A4Y7J637_PAPSO|nr:hypothetical protein C5167_014767 [Papaver somniferum]
MEKMSVFLSFFLFVLIAMPTSSSSRMILEEVEAINKCPKPDCSLVRCKLPIYCPKVFLICPKGKYTPCCSCPKCCK